MHDDVEDNDGQTGQHQAGKGQVVIDAELGLEVVQIDGQRPQLAGAVQGDQRHLEVVPDGQALADQHGGKDGRHQGKNDAGVDLEGGSGKASVTSPTIFTVKNRQAYAQIQWSSSNYDYMVVDGEKYFPTNEEGMNSVFEIPILTMDEGMPVIADTTAMGAPHEIDYTLTFYSDSIGSKSQLPQEAAKRVVAVALVIIVGGGILNYFVNKRNRC